MLKTARQVFSKDSVQSDARESVDVGKRRKASPSNVGSSGQSSGPRNQYENIINQGLRTIGKSRCPPATIARGNMTAHDVIRHPAGTAGVDRTIMAAMARMQRMNTRE